MSKRLLLVVLGVGALATCCICFCLFGVVSQSGEPVASPDRTPQPTSTPQPQPTATSAISTDDAYLTCHGSVASVGFELLQDIVLVSEIAAEEPQYLCVYLDDMAIYNRSLSLATIAQNCPQPQRSCLTRLRTLTVDGTGKIAQAVTLFTEWCLTEDYSDISLILQGAAIFQEGGQAIERSADVFNNCVK